MFLSLSNDLVYSKRGKKRRKGDKGNREAKEQERKELKKLGKEELLEKEKSQMN